MYRLLFLPPTLLWIVALIPAPQSTPSVPAPASTAAPVQANPVTPTPESQAHAKKVWGYDCSMCHGENGNGKGDVVDAMKLTMMDFTDPSTLKNVSDGEMFNVIKNGKGQMPGEGARTKDEDIWNLVIYIRSMSKKPA